MDAGTELRTCVLVVQ